LLRATLQFEGTGLQQKSFTQKNAKNIHTEQGGRTIDAYN